MTTLRDAVTAARARRGRRGPLLAVALIGADGSGKTTLVERVIAAAPGDVATLYLGQNRYVLPGMARLEASRGRFSAALFRWAALPLDLLLRRWRSLRAANGRLMLTDRLPMFPFTGGSRTLERLYRLVLPRFDLLVLLDADAAVFHERKPEGDPFEHRRQQEKARALPKAGLARASAVVDTSGTVDSSLARLEALLVEQLQTERGLGRAPGRPMLAKRASRKAQATAITVVGTPVDRWVASMRARRFLEANGLRPVRWSALHGDSGLFPARVELEGGRCCFVKAAGWAWLGRRRTSRRERSLLAVLDTAERLHRSTGLSRRIHAAGVGPAVLVAGDGVSAWDWVEGVPLITHLAAGGDGALALAAVETLHRTGQAHGDLHAGNVLLGADGTVNLLDPEDRFHPSITPTQRFLYDWGLLLGSVCDRSPEAQALVRQRLNAPAHGVEGTLGDALAGFLARYRSDNRFLGALADWMTTIEAQA
jgi:hypothetical protein